MGDKLISVGIDIGTSTTQIMFSQLIIENLASDYAVPRLSIVDKRIMYESEIHFTPLLSENKIDAEAVYNIVSEEYQRAGITYEQVRTGAVIITGETARKENAAVVLETLSGFAGTFVVATAGPDLESVLAGYGAGTDRLSEQTRSCIANIDIGGGTSNISIFNRGKLIGVACLDVGGRLVRIDKASGKITYIYSRWKKYAADHGIILEEGMEADKEKLSKICMLMTDALLSTLKLSDNGLDKKFYTNDSPPILEDFKIDGITFSGGVASFIYGKKTEDDYQYGDIGILLAESIKKSVLFCNLSWFEPKETIRATVVGAGMYTTEISGSTICYSAGILPLKNIPVLHIDNADMKDLGTMIKRGLLYYMKQTDLNITAISFDGSDDTSFDGIQKRAEEICASIDDILAHKLPLILIIETDIAKALGFALKKRLPADYPLICIDGIRSQNGDYIDIGCPMADGQVLPVIIKTLVFNS